MCCNLLLYNDFVTPALAMSRFGWKGPLQLRSGLVQPGRLASPRHAKATAAGELSSEVGAFPVELL